MFLQSVFILLTRCRRSPVSGVFHTYHFDCKFSEHDLADSESKQNCLRTIIVMN